MADYLELAIDAGALIEVPIWVSHKRGKNWCATIEKDPESPGGLQRGFWMRAKGNDYFYIVSLHLKSGTPIEFGADYYTGSGTPKRDRWYGYVVEVTQKKLILCKCVTAAGAINEGKLFAQESQPPVDSFSVWWEQHIASNEIRRSSEYTFDFLRATAEAAWRAQK